MRNQQGPRLASSKHGKMKGVEGQASSATPPEKENIIRQQDCCKLQCVRAFLKGMEDDKVKRASPPPTSA